MMLLIPYSRLVSASHTMAMRMAHPMIIDISANAIATIPYSTA